MMDNGSVGAYLLETMQDMGAYHNAFPFQDIFEKYNCNPEHKQKPRGLLLKILGRLKKDGYVQRKIRMSRNQGPAGIEAIGSAVKYKLTSSGLQELERLNQAKPFWE